jgi:Tol biopolymer transport system component
MNPDGTERTSLSPSAGFESTPDWSPDGTKIAFTSTRDEGFGEIYVVNADGSGLIRLTNNPGFDSQSAWSLDGTRIIFVSGRTGNQEIFDMRSDGSEVRQLTFDPAQDNWPEVSPDGQSIVFTSNRSGASAIYVMDMNDNNVQRLTPDALQAGHPDYSPDGRKIVFSNNVCSPGPRCGDRAPLSNVFVMSLNDGRVVQLTRNFGNNLNPGWSPDGQKITFWHAGGSPGINNSDIYKMNGDGSGLVNLTHSPSLFEAHAAWGPG